MDTSLGRVVENEADAVHAAMRSGSPLVVLHLAKLKATLGDVMASIRAVCKSGDCAEVKAASTVMHAVTDSLESLALRAVDLELKDMVSLLDEARARAGFRPLSDEDADEFLEGEVVEWVREGSPCLPEFAALLPYLVGLTVNEMTNEVFFNRILKNMKPAHLVRMIRLRNHVESELDLPYALLPSGLLQPLSARGSKARIASKVARDMRDACVDGKITWTTGTWADLLPPGDRTIVHVSVTADSDVQLECKGRVTLVHLFWAPRPFDHANAWRFVESRQFLVANEHAGVKLRKICVRVDKPFLATCPTTTGMKLNKDNTTCVQFSCLADATDAAPAIEAAGCVIKGVFVGCGKVHE